ncbi:SPOR domain-containing protein [Thauera sp.]|jgi:hypothetical protein|uniref:SPOR domain-containing protein n=1 Tax=Thauera sp. TaxID=1905334 RepID=UPI00261B5E2C|nr:SPOR domain-containing protein [Thauera sp.]MCK6407901.1 SPOR domain-containing protein [Thauera sp.]
MTILRFLIILLLVLNALAFAAVMGWLGSGPPAGEAGRIAAQLHPERIRLAGEAAGSGLAPTPAATPLAVAEAAVEAATEHAALPAAPPPLVPAAQAPAAAASTPAPSPDPAAADEQPEASSALPSEAAIVPAPSPAPPALCHAWGELTASEADRVTQRLRRIGITPLRSRSETPEAWWVRIPPQRSRAEAERRVVELNLRGVADTFIVQEAGPTQHAVSLGLFKTENRARVLLGQLRAKGVDNAGIEPRMTSSYRIQANVPANELRIVESAAPGLRAKRQACTR